MLKEYLNKLKDLTLDSIEALQEENLDLVDTLIEKREKLINLMKNEDYDLDEFKSMSLKLDILKLDEKLVYLMNEKKEYIKKEMINLKVSKQAHRSYNINSNNKSYFLREKI